MKTRANREDFRRLRVRRKIFGTTERPRLAVYRSLKHIYAQIIDDLAGKTLAAASTLEKGAEKATGIKAASKVGQLIAEKAKKKGVQKVVFDRAGKPYIGQIRALADKAREHGLEF